MPIFISNRNPVYLQKYSAIGSVGMSERFVAHVGILAEACTAGLGNQVQVHHMAPPLQFDSKMDFHVAGNFGDLHSEASEAIQAKLFLLKARAGTQDLRIFDNYVIHPATQHVLTSDGKSILQYRYSCAGFVCECFEAADIHLVDKCAIPPIGLDLLKEIYGARYIEFAIRYGKLSSSEPGNILMPGYVINAFKLNLNQLPFRPTLSDVAI